MLIGGCPRGHGDGGVSGPADVMVLSGREEHSWSKTGSLDLADFLEQQLKQSMEGGNLAVVV